MKGSLISQNHFWLDVLHVFVGIAVTVLAVFAFLSPEEYPFFFSLIFGLAGLLTLVNGQVRFTALRRAHRKQGSAVVVMLLGAILLGLCAVSAVVML